MRAKTFYIANIHRSFHFTIQNVYVLEYKSVYILGNSCIYKMSTHPQVKMLFDLVLFLFYVILIFFAPLNEVGLLESRSVYFSSSLYLQSMSINLYCLLFADIYSMESYDFQKKKIINKQTINAHNKHAIDANTWLNCFHLKIAIKRIFSNQFNMSLLCLSIKQTIFHAELFVPYLSTVSRELLERVEMNINDIYITWQQIRKLNVIHF